jgi:hypothetical protein
LPLFDSLNALNPRYPPAKEVSYPVFEFEQYELGREIFKEIIKDEILLYKSRSSREYFDMANKQYPNGCIPLIFGQGEAP